MDPSSSRRQPPPGHGPRWPPTPGRPPPGPPPGRPGPRASRGARRPPAVPRRRPSRICSSSGISPRNGTPNSSAALRPPPWWKMGVAVWQCGQTNWLMFSTMPSTGNLHLVEHVLGAHHVGQRHVLRRRHQHRARGPDALRHGERHVARARREVHHQVVERAPVHVTHELLERAVEHRPAPDERLVRLDQEAERHHLDAHRLERLEPLPVGAHRTLVRQPGHHGDRRAVEVGVEQAHAGPVLRQRRPRGSPPRCSSPPRPCRRRRG